MNSIAHPKFISTVADLIDALGGLGPASEFLGATTNTARQWRYRGRIPARFFVTHVSTLSRVGIQASPALWGQASESAAA